VLALPQLAISAYPDYGLTRKAGTRTSSRRADNTCYSFSICVFPRFNSSRALVGIAFYKLLAHGNERRLRGYSNLNFSRPIDNRLHFGYTIIKSRFV